MSRRVTHDGAGAFQVRFPFDRGLVDRIKSLPNRRWNAGERYWSVPDTDVVLLVDLLLPERFEFDATTCESYRRFGGRAALEPAPASRAPALPGLFDSEDDAPTPAAVTDVGLATDYTVSGLNQRVKSAIESAFPSQIWLVGEISGFNKNAHRRHVGFDLVERTAEGSTTSKVPATLFESTRSSIADALREAGDPFALEDELTVRMRVRVELYVPWGQYRVVVEQLDVDYTLGEAARRREEIVRRLTEAGLIGVNSALPLPPLPLRIALVTSLGSDAYNDVLRTLQESGFAFRVTAHGARVQGHATEPSVLNALDWIRKRRQEFDVVLICRGGGSRTDLVWFDSEALGREVASYPLPVVVAIGHEQDRSVLDSVARSCKTPTAAAGLLVGAVGDGLERIETLGREILELATRGLREQRAVESERALRLARAARALLNQERVALGHRRRRAVVGARSRVAGARERLARDSGLVPRAADRLIEGRRQILRSTTRSLLHGARRDVSALRATLERLADGLSPAAHRRVRNERERLEARDHRVQLVHPRKVIERGYSVLRLVDGQLLTEADMAPPGSEVRAELKQGALRLRSEGATDPRGER